MVSDTDTYANELRSMVEDYYHHRIGFAEYRQRRYDLLQAFDERVNGNARETQLDETGDDDAGILDRLLGRLKKNENEFLSD